MGRKNIFNNGGFSGYVADITKVLKPILYVSTGLQLYIDAKDASSYSGTGTTVKDLSNNALTGTMVNGVGFNSTSPKAFTFDGSNDVITFPENSSHNSQSISIEVWVKPVNVSNIGFWFEKGLQVNTQYSFFLYGNTIYWRIWGVADVTATASSYMTSGAWHQMVGTVSSPGTAKIYMNGSPITTVNVTSALLTSAGGISIGDGGGQSGSRGYPYQGSIGIVRLYNTKLTDAEVLQNYNANKADYGLS